MGPETGPAWTAYKGMDAKVAMINDMYIRCLDGFVESTTCLSLESSRDNGTVMP